MCVLRLYWRHAHREDDMDTRWPTGHKEFCVKPAVALRQRIRDELHRLDPEYAKVSIGVK